MAAELTTIESTLGRKLTIAEETFLQELEAQGVTLDVPPVEPEPTERDLIMQAADCEHIVVKPEKDNPFGYARGHVYRSKTLGREAVVSYDFADILREGNVVGEEAVTEHIEVRDVQAEVTH